MKQLCDPLPMRVNLYSQEETGHAGTLPLSNEANADVAPDSTVYGIELLNAHQQLRPDEQGKLLVTKESAADDAAFRLGSRKTQGL